MNNDTYAELKIEAAPDGGYVVSSLGRPGDMHRILFAGDLDDSMGYIRRSLVKVPEDE